MILSTIYDLIDEPRPGLQCLVHSIQEITVVSPFYFPSFSVTFYSALYIQCWLLFYILSQNLQVILFSRWSFSRTKKKYIKNRFLTIPSTVGRPSMESLESYKCVYMELKKNAVKSYDQRKLISGNFTTIPAYFVTIKRFKKEKKETKECKQHESIE